MILKRAMYGLEVFLTVLSCGIGSVSQSHAAEERIEYTQISQDEAKEMMAEDDDLVIIDVRTQEEYDSGHIPEAICIPNESIITEQPKELPDLEQLILVYCRSGRRSKEASQKLADIGYTNVYEFGGILDWTGDIVTEVKTEKAAPTPKPTATPEPTLSPSEKNTLRKKDPYDPKYYDTPEEYADFIADNGADFDEDDYGWDGDLFYDDLWDDAYEEWERANK